MQSTETHTYTRVVAKIRLIEAKGKFAEVYPLSCWSCDCSRRSKKVAQNDQQENHLSSLAYSSTYDIGAEERAHFKINVHDLSYGKWSKGKRKEENPRSAQWI